MMRKTEKSEIGPARYETVIFTIEGDAPYVQLRFSQKQRNKLKEDYASGGREAGAAKPKRNREKKDFDALYEEAMYLSPDGHRGINAMSFKRAMLAACRLTAMSMKQGKLSFSITPDGYDEFEELPIVYLTEGEPHMSVEAPPARAPMADRTPLVYFTEGEPHMTEHVTRNANGMPDLRIRAMWDAGWRARPRVRYDADMISLSSVRNLLERAGAQVGVGEGRPDATRSDGSGMGWGTFTVIDMERDS
jgi:hypothetical protein